MNLHTEDRNKKKFRTTELFEFKENKFLYLCTIFFILIL